MNDREAIEILKNECANTYAERKALAIQTILNLIEKQKHIIEGKECVIETQAHNEEVLNKIIDEKQAEIELQTLLEDESRKQLKIRDEIIDLMAEHLEKHSTFFPELYGARAKDWKQYFENKVKESK